MEDEDFLDAISANEEDVVEASVKAEPEPAPVEPEVLELTDEVKPAEPAPAEPAPEPMRSDDAADGRLAALLDERDKRKALEAEVARLREASQAQQQPIQMPDPYEDPEGFAAAQQQVNNQQLYQTRLFFSEQLATVKHGEDTVTAAKDWGFKRCETDPYFNAKVAASPDPVGFVVTEYKREEIASKVDLSEYEAFQAWKTAQGQLQQQAAQAAPPNTAPAIPPRSLASAPSAGGISTQVELSEEDIFTGVIPKR